MNVYDFDRTIYSGDSTLDFYWFIVKNHPKVLKIIPRSIIKLIQFKLGMCTKEVFKEEFYAFLKDLENVEILVEQFWDTHIEKINEWYLLQRNDNDIVITASPYFLIRPLKKRLKIQSIIASHVSASNGKLLGPNCYGKEKVRRFLQEHSVNEIDAFYSDSRSDKYFAQISPHAYLVKGKKKRVWTNEK